MCASAAACIESPSPVASPVACAWRARVWRARVASARLWWVRFHQSHVFGRFVYGFKDCPRFTEFWEIHSELAQVYIDGVDSTPLLEGERGEDRQKTMMSIVLAYMNHAKLRGFKRLYLRIAPPTDENGFIFRRPPNVRFRASLHLSLWFKYIVQAASRNGIVHGCKWSASAVDLEFPTWMLREVRILRFGCFVPYGFFLRFSSAKGFFCSLVVQRGRK